MRKNRNCINYLSKKWVTILSVFFSLNLLYLLNRTGFLGYSTHQPYIKIIQPPQLTDSEKHLLLSLDALNDTHRLKAELSNIVQNKIAYIQESTNCSERNFICGHYDKCGFGCQIHHRAACVMMSFALNMPLIHDETEGWAYSMKWSNIFYPLGANCAPGPNTYRWNWKKEYLYLDQSYYGLSEAFENIEYPLNGGLPVPEQLGKLVDKIYPNPFLWWVGQFMKYTLRPRKHLQMSLSKDKTSIGFKHPIIGMHIRRTDKIHENAESYHDMDEYMIYVEPYFRQIETHGQLKNQSIKRRVFIASDDSSVLSKAKNRYSQWNVIGFQSVTLWNPRQRLNSLNEIVRDVLILSECDYVICGLTSNVCRLILEMLSYTHLNATALLKPVDGSYQYIVQRHTLHDPKILKIR